MKKVVIGIIFLATLLWSWNSEQISYSSSITQSKKYGVEFNPFRLIILTSSWISGSASFSIFDYTNNTEISFPILYSSEETNSGFKDFKIFTLDVHYRKFLYNKVGGLYLSGVARVAQLEGRLRESKIEDGGENYAKVTKLGIGLGVGYRLLPLSSNWYWGIGLIAGRYLGSDYDMFYGGDFSAIDDAPIFVDIELLKIGYRF